MRCSCRSYRNAAKGFRGRLNKADPAHCAACPLRSRCMRKAHTPARQVVKLEAGVRHGRESHTQQMVGRFDSPRGRHYYSRRMGCVEPVFANSRSTLGLDWFSLRGRQNVVTQSKLFCLVHNMGKIARYGRRAKKAQMPR